MFSNLNLFNLRNSEFIQYSDYILEILKTKNPEHLQVKEIYDRISSKSKLLTSIFKPDRGSEITPQLQEADERRDNAINGITGLLEDYTYHYNPEIHNAAQFLLNEISTYGRGIARLNYQSETSTIESIVERWKGSDECINALNKLNILDWVEEMDKANQEFRQYYFERMQENAESPEIRLKEVRRELTDLFRMLTNTLEVHATMKDDEIFDKTIRSINELNDRYNELVMLRQNSEEEEEQASDDLATEINNN